MFQVQKNNLVAEMFSPWKRYHIILETTQHFSVEMLIQFSMDQKLYPP